MDNIVSLYTSRDGRIGRKTWWLASIALVVVILVLEFAILTPLGIGPMPNLAAGAAGDTAAATTAIADNFHRAQWVSLVIYLILGWPIVALGVKRRHDKDNSGLDVMIFYGVAVLLNLAGALGVGYGTTDLGNGVMLPTPSMPLGIIDALYGIFAIYLLVVLGILRGTAGTNQYGPDPLVVGAVAAA